MFVLKLLATLLVVSAHANGGLRGLAVVSDNNVKGDKMVAAENAAVAADLSDSHIVWENEGARGDSHSWANAHNEAKKAAAHTASDLHAKAEKKNTLTNHDGQAAKVAKKAAVQTPTEQPVAVHQSNVMNVAVGACAGMALVAIAVVMKKRSALPADGSSADATASMASSLPTSNSLAMTTADTKGAFL
jgi:hypothetical protein